MQGYSRDTIWNDAIWAEIDDVVADVFRRRAVVRQAVPVETAPTVGTALANWVPQLATVRARLVERDPTLLAELFCAFSLSESEVDSEPSSHRARASAEHAAKTLALAEDVLFLSGNNTPGCTILGRNLVTRTRDSLSNVAPPGVAGADLLLTIASAAQQLENAGFPGPFAAFLSPTLSAEGHTLIAGTSTTPLAALRERVSYHFSTALGALGPREVLLVASDAVVVYVAQDARLSFTRQSPPGRLWFRVSERLIHVVRDPTAMVRVTVPTPPVRAAPRPPRRRNAPRAPAGQ